MAFPVVEGRTEFEDASNKLEHVVPLPPGAVGDLLFILAYTTPEKQMTAPGFTVVPLPEAGTNATYCHKIADGNEGSSVTFTLTSYGLFNALVWRISGANRVEAGISHEEDRDLDPYGLTPSWGLDDVLWMTYAMQLNGNSSTYIVSYPDGFSQGREIGDIVKMAAAEREERAETMDPGPFTNNTLITTYLLGTIGISHGAALGAGWGIVGI